MLEALGVNTSKSFALFETGEALIRGGRLIDWIMRDKKNSGGALALILTRGIGKAYLDRSVDPGRLAAFLATQPVPFLTGVRGRLLTAAMALLRLGVGQQPRQVVGDALAGRPHQAVPVGVEAHVDVAAPHVGVVRRRHRAPAPPRGSAAR